MVVLSAVDHEVFLVHLMRDHEKVVWPYNQLGAAHEVKNNALELWDPRNWVKLEEIYLELSGERQLFLPFRMENLTLLLHRIIKFPVLRVRVSVPLIGANQVFVLLIYIRLLEEENLVGMPGYQNTVLEQMHLPQPRGHKLLDRNLVIDFRNLVTFRARLQQIVERVLLRADR